MTTEKILSVIQMYEDRLRQAGVPKERMDPSRAFVELSQPEILAHAHYLIDGVRQYAQNPAKQGKTGRHLATIQVCLSFAGWYTLQDLLDHNRH